MVALGFLLQFSASHNRVVLSESIDPQASFTSRALKEFCLSEPQLAERFPSKRMIRLRLTFKFLLKSNSIFTDLFKPGLPVPNSPDSSGYWGAATLNQLFQFAGQMKVQNR